MNSPDQILETAQGRFTVLRHPVRPRETLRAWDAADEYLLRFIGEDLAELMAEWDTANQTVVVVNDAFGALATALAQYQPVSWSDSFTSHQGLLANLSRNGLDAASVEVLPGPLELPERIDMVVMKVPRSNEQLAHQLRRLRPHLHADTVILASAMVKQIHTSTLEIFERELGPTHTSLAKKRARLIFTDLDTERPVQELKPPVEWTHAEHTIVNYPGIFSASRLDVGTRFFLKSLPPTEGPVRIVDLGCGNGILGLMAAAANPDARITFVDESYQAIASAIETFDRAFPDRPAEFIVADKLSDAVDPGTIDLILNNPPFHQNNALSDVVAWDMFNEAHAALNMDGELWVIGNRHLQYHLKIQRIFGTCDTVTGNPKFVVLKTQKAPRMPKIVRAPRGPDPDAPHWDDEEE